MFWLSPLLFVCLGWLVFSFLIRNTNTVQYTVLNTNSTLYCVLCTVYSSTCLLCKWHCLELMRPSWLASWMPSNRFVIVFIFYYCAVRKGFGKNRELPRTFWFTVKGNENFRYLEFWSRFFHDGFFRIPFSHGAIIQKNIKKEFHLPFWLCFLYFRYDMYEWIIYLGVNSTMWAVEGMVNLKLKAVYCYY